MRRTRREGERAELTIEKLVAGGYGLGRIEGEVVLVPRVAAGERVAIELDRTHRPARGRLLKVIERSDDRVTPRCLIAERCGGCDWMHLSQDAQKTARIALIRASMPASIEGLAIAWHSAPRAIGRTRARWHVVRVGERVLVGYRALGSSVVVAPGQCVALDPRLAPALSIARELLAGAQVEGEVSAALGERGLPVLALRLRGVLPGATFGRAESAVRDGVVAGVVLAIDGARAPAVIGDPRPRLPVAGGPALESPTGAFAQASEEGDAVLLELVVARAEPADRRVVELFSGSGNLSVALAATAAHLTAVELNEAAVEAARRNLAARGLGGRSRVIAADAEQFAIPAGTAVVVLDPPRAGARGACASIAESRVTDVVYVSCDPPTLGRDLHALIAAGFSVRSIDAIDLFPETSHVETVVTLRRPRRGDRDKRP